MHNTIVGFSFHFFGSLRGEMFPESGERHRAFLMLMSWSFSITSPDERGAGGTLKHFACKFKVIAKRELFMFIFQLNSNQRERWTLPNNFPRYSTPRTQRERKINEENFSRNLWLIEVQFVMNYSNANKTKRCASRREILEWAIK